jgi:hypothetical protein
MEKGNSGRGGWWRLAARTCLTAGPVGDCRDRLPRPLPRCASIPARIRRTPIRRGGRRRQRLTRHGNAPPSRPSPRPASAGSIDIPGMTPGPSGTGGLPRWRSSSTITPGMSTGSVTIFRIPLSGVSRSSRPGLTPGFVTTVTVPHRRSSGSRPDGPHRCHQ